MARKRTAIGSAREERIVSLRRAGGTLDSILAQLEADGTPMSRATLSRRLQELGAKVNEGRAELLRAMAPSGQGLPDNIPDGADSATIDQIAEMAQRMAAVAEAEGDLSALGAAGRLLIAAQEAKRKAKPPERADPNDNPDMKKLAADVAARLHRMIDQVPR